MTPITRSATRSLAPAMAVMLLGISPAAAMPGHHPGPCGMGGMGPDGGMGQMQGMQGMHAPAQTATIQVTGSGMATVAPDLAVVTLGVTAQAPTAGEAMSQNAARQRAVIAALQGRGIEPRDIQTSGLNLNPMQDYSREGQPPTITGYQASNMVTVRVRNLAQMGETIDAIVAAGANEVQGISFQRNDPGETEAEARRRAVANAYARAEVIAGAAGQRLGRLISISDTVEGAAPPQPMRMQAMVADKSSTPVQAGELSVSAEVTARWELLPAGDMRQPAPGEVPPGGQMVMPPQPPMPMPMHGGMGNAMPVPAPMTDGQPVPVRPDPAGPAGVAGQGTQPVVVSPPDGEPVIAQPPAAGDAAAPAAPVAPPADPSAPASGAALQAAPGGTDAAPLAAPAAPAPAN